MLEKVGNANFLSGGKLSDQNKRKLKRTTRYMVASPSPAPLPGSLLLLVGCDMEPLVEVLLYSITIRDRNCENFSGAILKAINIICKVLSVKANQAFNNANIL
jgi:hypothetical protein